MIKKVKAIEILEELAKRINIVKQCDHTNSPDFIKWHCDAEAAIENIFPENKGRLAQFKSIDYTMGFDIRISQGAYVNFFWSALDKANAVLQSMVDEVQTYWNESGAVPHKLEQTSTLVDSKIVFVVHGRNEAMRKSMFSFLRAIGLNPLEWSQAVNATGAATPYVGQVLDKAFTLAQAVVVLMTPDDAACLRKEFQTDQDDQYEKQLTPQARPNVLFEAGMAMGRDAQRTVLVQIGKLRPFSDVGGRHILQLDNTTQCRQQLAERLKIAGCDINLSGIDWHTVGSFELDASKSLLELGELGIADNTISANQSETEPLVSQWREAFLAVVAGLKAEMKRGQIPSDWYPSFERSIIEFEQFVATIPRNIDSIQKSEIFGVVDRLSKMTDSQVVSGAGQVFEMLEKLETLIHDT